MNTVPLAHYLPGVSRLIYGCMGFGGGWDQQPIGKADLDIARAALDAALDAGLNFFDHADIYTRGKAETVFGQLLKERPGLRDKLYIQSKCGIRFADDQGNPGRYDFSKDWIIGSVEGSLKRLNIDHLDVLLLHRPDPLMEPDEVAEAFSTLKSAGKVRYFGVSNMQLHQIQFLQWALPEPLVVNQIEISLAQLDWLEEGVLAGNPAGRDVNFTAGTLEYCRRNGVQLQSWGSLARGLFSGRAGSEQTESVRNTAQLVAKLAGEYGVSKEAIVLGWLMRHPANIQAVIGTVNGDRIKACAQAESIRLSREQWYTLYVSARGTPLP